MILPLREGEQRVPMHYTGARKSTKLMVILAVGLVALLGSVGYYYLNYLPSVDIADESSVAPKKEGLSDQPLKTNLDSNGKKTIRSFVLARDKDIGNMKTFGKGRKSITESFTHSFGKDKNIASVVRTNTEAQANASNANNSATDASKSKLNYLTYLLNERTKASRKRNKKLRERIREAQGSSGAKNHTPKKRKGDIEVNTDNNTDDDEEGSQDQDDDDDDEGPSEKDREANLHGWKDKKSDKSANDKVTESNDPDTSGNDDDSDVDDDDAFEEETR